MKRTSSYGYKIPKLKNQNHEHVCYDKNEQKRDDELENDLPCDLQIQANRDYSHDHGHDAAAVFRLEDFHRNSREINYSQNRRRNKRSDKRGHVYDAAGSYRVEDFQKNSRGANYSLNRRNHKLAAAGSCSKKDHSFISHCDLRQVSYFSY